MFTDPKVKEKVEKAAQKWIEEKAGEAINKWLEENIENLPKLDKNAIASLKKNYEE